MDKSLADALGAAPFLAGVSRPALEILAGGCRFENYPDATWIVREGEAGHSLFVLVEGQVDVIKHAGQPHETTLARLTSRTFFGEMCVVDPVPRGASVRTVGPVAAIELPALTLYRLYRQMPEQYAIVILNLARDMARRLRSLDEAFAARAS